MHNDTATPTAIKHLLENEVFNDDSEIRNTAFVHGPSLHFAECFEEACESNEDSWRLIIVKKADEYGVTMRGICSGTMNLLVDSLRNYTSERQRVTGRGGRRCGGEGWKMQRAC